MKRTLWPAFLGVVLVLMTLWGIWDLATIGVQVTRVLQELTIEFGKTEDVPATTGRHVNEIARGDVGVAALGVNNVGDYAPLMLVDSDGSVRSAGKFINQWISIRVDSEGRVICSPESFWGLNLKPGETMIIHGPPRPPIKIEVKP